MSDNLSSNDVTRIGNTVRRAYSNETLSADERRRHQTQLSEARSRAGTSTLRPGRMELAVVATMLILVLAAVAVWQGLPGAGTADPDSPTMPLGSDTSIEKAVPEPVVSIEQMRTLAEPSAPGTGYTYTVLFTSDIRLDQSATTTWEAEIWDRTLEDGTRQQRVTIYDQSFEVIADYVRNGDHWYWENRGWVESGDMSEALNLPPEVAMALAEPANIVALLGDEVGGRPPVTGQPLVADEEFPGLFIMQYDADLPPGVDGIAEIHGITQYQYAAEMMFNTDPPGTYSLGDKILSSDRVIVESGARAEDALSISLGRFTYLTEPQLDAAYFSDDHFAIPEVPIQRYAGPDPEILAFGLEVVDRYLITPEGGERLLLASETVQVEILVSPSLGGIDITAWQATAPPGELDIAPPFVATVADGFNIHWQQAQRDGSISAAAWDDGRYLFQTIAIPRTWSGQELVVLVEALSMP